MEVSPSEDRLEFDWLDLSDWSVLDLKWRSSTREEQEVVEPDLSLEVVASLGEDLVVTACTQRSECEYILQDGSIWKYMGVHGSTCEYTPRMAGAGCP